MLSTGLWFLNIKAWWSILIQLALLVWRYFPFPTYLPVSNIFSHFANLICTLYSIQKEFLVFAKPRLCLCVSPDMKWPCPITSIQILINFFWFDIIDTSKENKRLPLFTKGHIDNKQVLSIQTVFKMSYFIKKNLDILWSYTTLLKTLVELSPNVTTIKKYTYNIMNTLWSWNFSKLKINKKLISINYARKKDWIFLFSLWKLYHKIIIKSKPNQSTQPKKLDRRVLK